MKYVLSFLTICALIAFAVQPVAAKTHVVTYGVAGMHSKGKAVKGYCWTSSNASTRSDAYRCMIGNNIMDPCFAVSPKVVDCPQDLVMNTGVVINLTKPLPKNNGMKNGKPWTFQLAGGSGIICNAGTGTVIGNYPYYCQGNLVCTVPKMKSPGMWVAQCGTPTGPMTVKNVSSFALMTVWQ